MKKRIAVLMSLALGLSACAGGSLVYADTTESASSVESTAIQRAFTEINAGTVMGFEQDGVYAFRGIPYATAERFQNPVPVENFANGIHFGLNYGTVAPQDRCLDGTAEVNMAEFMTPSNGTADMVANENCQNLNVWTNSLEGNKPVVVFFHGGGLVNGSSIELSSYTGEYIARSEDVVFVSVNHRLNVLGFLDVSEYGGEEYAESANASLKDCVCALQWVQDNIAAFGGDPSNVTIVGQSGGVQKVTSLACMAEAEGLFDKVVCLSGDYVTTNGDDSKANTRLLVDYLGLSDDEVIETLTNMSYEELYNASTAAGCSWNAAYGVGSFETPLFDAETGEMNPYAAKRTWMLGSTVSEGSTNARWRMSDPAYSIDFTTASEEESMEVLTAKYGEAAEEIAEVYQQAYPGHNIVEAAYLDSGDRNGSRYGIIGENGMLDRLVSNGATVYNYVAAYTLPYFGGVTMHHSCDIPFWFNSIDELSYQIQGDEENAHKVAETMSGALADFAASGSPASDELAWEAYTADAHHTMVFDVTSEDKVDYDKELLELVMNTQE